MLNISLIPKKLYLLKQFVPESGDFKYCNFLNSKLRRNIFFKGDFKLGGISALRISRRFLSDIVATLLTRCKLGFKKRAEQNLIRMLIEMLKQLILTYI